MAGEKAKLVREAYAAWNARDLDRALELVHPDVEVVQDPQIPGATSARGSAAFRAWLESFFETWDSFEIEPEEIVECDDRVLVLGVVRARGKTTGIEVETKLAHLLTMRDARVTRWQSYTDPAAARAAARDRVEIVRRLYSEPVTALAFDFYAPDIAWDMSEYAGWADDPVYHGHEGVRTFMRGWIESFDRWEPVIEQIVEAGDEVIAVIRDTAYLRGSGMPIRRRFAHGFVFEGERITRSRLYSDPEQALRAAACVPAPTSRGSTQPSARTVD